MYIACCMYGVQMHVMAIRAGWRPSCTPGPAEAGCLEVSAVPVPGLGLVQAPSLFEGTPGPGVVPAPRPTV